jgi:16S rRNA processing protein RimM
LSGAPGPLLAGQVGRPHGIAGEVYVLPISDDPSRFRSGSELVHESAGDLVIESVRNHRERLLVKFRGIETRTDAEALRGALYVPRERLRALGRDEYWEHELRGCSVVDGSGEQLGVVTGLVAGRAQDLFVVDTPAGERLVPIVKDIVVDVSVAERRVRIDPPLGLLD